MNDKPRSQLMLANSSIGVITSHTEVRWQSLDLSKRYSSILSLFSSLSIPRLPYLTRTSCPRSYPHPATEKHRQERLSAAYIHNPPCSKGLLYRYLQLLVHYIVSLPNTQLNVEDPNRRPEIRWHESIISSP